MLIRLSNNHALHILNKIITFIKKFNYLMYKIFEYLLKKKHLPKYLLTKILKNTNMKIPFFPSKL